MHECSQEGEISSVKKDVSFLYQNHKDVMEVIKEIREDVKELKKYMFEGGMDSKYAKKTSVDRLWNMVWGVIIFFAIAIGSVLTSKLFK